MEIILKNLFIVNRFLIALIFLLFITTKESNKEVNIIDMYYSFYDYSFYESYIINIELDKYLIINILAIYLEILQMIQ